jgi:ketosteroid isomerase-like protein
MIKALLIGVLIVGTGGPAHSQAAALRSVRATPKSDNPQSLPAEAEIRDLEQRVDTAIFNGDTAFLQNVFSEDFRFMHFDGEVTDKVQSLQQVAKRPYVMRRLDSVKIEMHGDVAITEGLVDISAHGEHGNHSYLVKYLRVYQRKNSLWQMLSQQSVGETSPLAF